MFTVLWASIIKTHTHTLTLVHCRFIYLAMSRHAGFHKTVPERAVKRSIQGWSWHNQGYYRTVLLQSCKTRSPIKINRNAASVTQQLYGMHVSLIPLSQVTCSFVIFRYLNLLCDRSFTVKLLYTFIGKVDLILVFK